MTELTFESILKDPRSYFASPTDVVHCRQISRLQRIEVLKQWRHDALLMQVAESENMAGGEKTELAEIDRALRACGSAIPKDGLAM